MTTALRRTLVAIATIRIALGLAGYAVLFASGADGPASAWVAGRPMELFLLNALAYTIAAAILFIGGRRDARALYLAIFFLLIGAIYSGEPVASLLPFASGWLAPFLTAPSKMALDAFLPLFLWLFVRDFPESLLAGAPRRVLRWGIRVSIAVGTTLFLANLVARFAPVHAHDSGLVPRLVRGFVRWEATSLYYGPMALLMIAALCFMVWKGRAARRDERRRAGLFLFSLVLGLGPIVVELALEATVPGYHEWSNSPVGHAILSIFIFTGLLSVPFTTTYAVLVNQVLDVRLILRKALQYALARTTLAAAAAVPFIALGLYVYAHRAETITGFLTGWRLALLLLAATCGVAALLSRRRLLEGIDRRFFRESFDAQKILVQLVQRSRGANDTVDLAALFTSEIDRALHLDSIALLALDSATSMLVAPDGAVRPLDASSKLAAMIAAGADPLPVDLEASRSPFARLPLEDRVWISDGGFRLLVPMIGSEGVLVGVIALGEKKSELPFQSEDRLLLSAVAASGALALENRLLRASSGRSPSSQEGNSEAIAQGRAPDDAAVECRFCMTVHVSGTADCDTCRGPLVPAPIPYILGGKFRFDRRIGSGGMGVVYRAVDLTLGRNVAIKTLPRISPENAMRLRREARAAAAVSHPNLALIFGAESWRGTPMLVFEYLEGGTLLDRLEHSPLSATEAVALGLVLASALEKAHGAGVLHRDIKPSNIGYTADGTPKLLDFGLARILDGRDGRRREWTSGPRKEARESSQQETLELETYSLIDTFTDQVVGTPSYLSPEAVIGEPPDPTFDLWGLGVVLYEALAGKNPMAGGSPHDVLKRIRHGQLPDPLLAIANCSPAMASFLLEALAKDPARRPATAHEFRTRLERL